MQYKPNAFLGEIILNSTDNFSLKILTISLHERGRVFKTEDFENPDIQKQIAVNGKELELPVRNGLAPLENEVAKEAGALYKDYNCDLFHRDLAKYIKQKPPQNGVA